MTKAPSFRYTEEYTKYAIIKVFGRTSQESLENAKGLAGRLRDALPKDSMVRDLEYTGFDSRHTSHVCEIPILIGLDEAAAKKAIEDLCST